MAKNPRRIIVEFLGCEVSAYQPPDDILEHLWRSPADISIKLKKGFVWAQIEDDGPIRPCKLVRIFKKNSLKSI